MATFDDGRPRAVLPGGTDHRRGDRQVADIAEAPVFREAVRGHRRRHDIGGGESGSVAPHPPMLIPPSTVRTAPVTYDARSSSRNATACASSSGRPQRPTGIIAVTASRSV